MWSLEGAGGWGHGGFGAGGGGSGIGTVGAGMYGVIGRGSGTGTGAGVGSGSGWGRGRKSRVPKMKIANPISTGELDKSIIRRYIRAQRARILNCYQKELLVDENAKGTVVVRFTIMGDGGVKGAVGTGMKVSLNRCVSNVISSITFPSPKGGGIVIVKRYPFKFSAR